MSEIFNKMYELSSRLYLDIAKNSREIEGDMLKKYPWTNRIFRSDRFRRAHLEVLDVRDTKKMWIMHICIFPHLDDSSPIFGFDVICGANKITGVFLDFSRADESHPMNIWFKEKTRNLVWKKDRELPDWGQRIFSPNMISAGNVNTDEELAQVIGVAEECLTYYLSNVGLTIGHFSNAMAHNHYCVNQKQNVHTRRFLINCGYNEKDVDIFIDKHLFPEIESDYP
jgi:hypothetical protein